MSPVIVSDHVDYERPHYLYRCYDAQDRLLYIGCTQDVGSRLQVHGSAWDNPVSAYLNLRMTRCEVEEPPYAGRLAGHAAEKAAIGAEAPLLNRHHNKGRGLVGQALEDELNRTRPQLDADLQAQLLEVLGTWGESA